MIRLGVVCSSGGSVMYSALRILRNAGYEIEAVLVTDRPCGAETVAIELGLKFKRVEYRSRDEFSETVGAWLFDECEMRWACLFFLRLISAHLFTLVPCVNVHPSLLPAFPGLRALERAHQSGTRFFGATAHLVDDSIDGGPIVAQVASPFAPQTDLRVIKRISFAQKVYLMLVLAERMNDTSDPLQTLQSRAFDGGRGLMSPPLMNSELSESFARFIQYEDIPWLAQTPL